MTNQKKGKELEIAVKQIYDLVLEYFGNDKIKSFVVHPNYKDIKYYEIDLYIELEYLDGRKGIQIVECKNWDSKTVERKDITDFIEKVKIANAEYGYFVAKSYTEGANWRIQKETNIAEVLVENTGVIAGVNWNSGKCINEKGENLDLKPRIIFEKSFKTGIGDRIKIEFYNEDKTYIIGNILEVCEGNKIVHSFSVENVSGENLDGVELGHA